MARFFDKISWVIIVPLEHVSVQNLQIKYKHSLRNKIMEQNIPTFGEVPLLFFLKGTVKRETKIEID